MNGKEFHWRAIRTIIIFQLDRLTLMIFNLTQSDHGNYTVEASNIVGTGSDTVALDVQSELLVIQVLTSSLFILQRLQ